jgi:deazaflavin-dependent oxidoreductase (nitroreductase family)
LFRTPAALYRMRLGWLFGQRLVLVEHTGWRTGRRHQAVLEVVERDAATGALAVASGFGSQADWYRNLLAHPETEVVLGRRRFSARAQRVPPEDGGEIERCYARRRRRMVHLIGYEVDGTDADFGEVGRAPTAGDLVTYPPGAAARGRRSRPEHPLRQTN